MGPTSLLMGVCVVVAMVTTSNVQVQDHRPKQIYSTRATEASQYLLSNWRHLYRALDINHDGIVDSKDHEDSKAQYIFLAGENNQLHDALVEKFDTWWTDDILPHVTGVNTEDEFLVHLTSMYLTDKAAFEAWANAATDLIHEALDFNSDGYVDWNEYRIASMILGRSKIAQDYSSFLAFEPVELVPLSKFADAWLDVACDATGNGQSIIQDTFMKDGYE